MIVNTETEIKPPDFRPAWDLYRNAFTPLNRMTVQRHLLNAVELNAVATDTRILKCSARDDEGRLVGLSVTTNYLDAWPLISPEFFAHRYPTLYAEQRIWYIGFVCAAPDAPRETFRELIAAMMEPIRASRGMGVLDYSSHLMAKRRIHIASEAIILGLAPLVEAKDIGSQHHVAYTFDWPI